jgi:plastocyanin
MKTKSLFAVVTMVAVAAQVASAGNIVGTITVNGTPPPEKDITPLKSDENCGKLHETMPTTHFYMVGAKHELADVVVSLKDISGKSTGASAAPAVLNQKGCEYVPSILAVQTGQKIVIKNSDPVLHNIHTDPKASGNKEENLPQMAGGPDLTFSIPKAESFLKFKCDVHPWMFAWVSVFDHPYFAVSGKDGTYKIANVPPGKYTLEAAHRKAGTSTKEVEVKDGDVTVDLTLDAK